MKLSDEGISFSGTIITDEVQVRQVLRYIGITVSDLLDAVRAGEAHRNMCTRNHPVWAPGCYSSAETTAALANRLVPKGFRRENVDNIALIVSADRSIAIVVSTGDDGTGRLAPVKTKYSKGAASLRAVRVNRDQGELFASSVSADTGESEADRDATTDTWLLLRRRVGDDVFVEFSRPFDYEDDGKISRWSTRLLLPRITVDPGLGFDDTQIDSEEVDFDIDVVRKTS